MHFSQFKEPSFSVVVKTMAQTKGFAGIFVLLLLSLLCLPYSCTQAQRQVQQRNAESLQYTADVQKQAAESLLDSMALVLNDSTSNIHYIDVGRTAQPDTSLEAGLACAELNHVAAMHEVIASAYLVCNLNHTIYNSLDSLGYQSDEFYDLTWRQQYFSSKGGLQLLDTPRTIRTPTWPAEVYISMISRVPYFSTLQNKYLIFNISLDEFTEKLMLHGRSMLAGEDTAYPTLLWIYNKNGELLWGQNEDLPATYAELQMAAQQAGSWTRLTANDTDYMAVTASSASYGWTFVVGTPYAYILREYSAQTRLILVLAGVMALAVLVTMFFFMYTRQLQILRAGQCVYQATQTDTNDGEDGLAYLQRISLEKTQASQSRQAILETFGDVLEQNIVLTLVQGEPLRKTDQPAYDTMMHSMGLLAEQEQRYTVFLARVEAITELKMNLHQNIYSRFRRILQYSCNEQLPEDVHASYAWTDSSTMVGILHFPQQWDAKRYKALLDQLGQSLQKQLTLLSEQPVVIAFGDVMEDPWHLVESFEHARQLLQHKIYYRKERPYTYLDMVETDTRLSYDRQKQLVDQIKLGKVQQTRELLESYFTILHSNPYIGLEQVQQICTGLATVVWQAVGEKEKNLEERFSDVERVKQTMLEMDTVHEVANYLVEYAQAAAQAMLEQMQRKKDIRVQDILEWIEDNYSQDIALDDIARQMELSPTYASKQIKMYTGQSVVNYINQVRIEHAKELLAHTRMSSNEIGARVGFRYSQSFIRAFRKSVGMTPGNYRSLHQKDAPQPAAEPEEV